MKLQAVIFDLDGVITDTAEVHYLAWKRLADEEGFPFDRQVNERLRGVSRRASLEIILDGRPASQEQIGEEQILEMMARKNSYYVAGLQQITPAKLLPGAVELIQELRGAGIKVGLGSASRNARPVLDRLGILPLLDVIADGHSVTRSKPAPDVFLHAASELGISPGKCAVVEDAASGIDGALAAGMWAIGLGPIERVGHAHARFDSLDGLGLPTILDALESASWTIAEPRFVPDERHHKETVFTIGNGYQCVRGAFEEGYPEDMPAGFVHRLWDDAPVFFTELANIPRWWDVAIWVDGERFRLDRGIVLGFRRWVDLRTGILQRWVRWRATENSPVVDLHFERLVPLSNAHQALMRVRIEAVGEQVDVRVITGLDGHVENVGLLHWRFVEQGQTADTAWLHVRTRGTGTELALAVAVVTTGDGVYESGTCDMDGRPVVERRARLESGKGLTLEKFVGVVSSNESETPLDDARRVAREASAQGYEALVAANASGWAESWDVADVVIEGDIEAQIALRFNIFQLIIAAPRFTDRASIGAKTLSGFGYRHHVFWDTEIFMLPLFIFTQPDIARNMLMYRYHTLAGARAKATANGYEGAQFAWESADDGREVTPTWVPNADDPTGLIRIWTGDIEIHITADIAYAAMQYWRVTGDDLWMRDFGAEIVLDGAKFWASAAQLEDDGKYHYRNVIGPDEYHDRIDDNAFTNGMAKWHLETGLDLLAWLGKNHPHRHAELSADLDLSEVRLAKWGDIIGCMLLPEDAESGLIEQFSGYFDLEDADFTLMRDPARRRSMPDLLGIEGCARTQILKQPDVLMLQYLLPDRFSPEQVRANYDYYDPRTDHEHGSSLGPSISAIMACRVGDIEAAYGHFLRAARTDLQDVRHNARDGIHGASAGGLWQAVVFGFCGLRVDEHGWRTQPALPPHWTRLCFKFYHLGKCQTVDINTVDINTVDIGPDKPLSVVRDLDTESAVSVAGHGA